MKRLPQIIRENISTTGGLDLVRLVDERDIVSMIPEVLLWGRYNGTVPKGGFVPNDSSVWIDMYFTPGTARYGCNTERSNHGPISKHNLVLPMGNDSALHAQCVRMLSKGRWIALAMDANDVIRLVGNNTQPLKLRQGGFLSNSNEWTLELVAESCNPAPYVQDWTDLYGNPADYSFDFSLQFNA